MFASNNPMAAKSTFQTPAQLISKLRTKTNAPRRRRPGLHRCFSLLKSTSLVVVMGVFKGGMGGSTLARHRRMANYITTSPSLTLIWHRNWFVPCIIFSVASLFLSECVRLSSPLPHMLHDWPQRIACHDSLQAPSPVLLWSARPRPDRSCTPLAPAELGQQGKYECRDYKHKAREIERKLMWPWGTPCWYNTCSFDWATWW